MSQYTFEKKFCENISKNPSRLMEVRGIIGSTAANTYPKSKFASPLGESGLIPENSPLEEVSEWSSPGKNESPHKNLSPPSPQTPI
jgi:hypothetical protein